MRLFCPLVAFVLRVYASQPISDRSVGLGFPHRVGRCRPGRTRFWFPGCRRMSIHGRMYEPGIMPYPPRVAFALRAPAHPRLASGIGVSTPWGAVSTRFKSIYVTGAAELKIYGRMSEPGMGTYPPRVALIRSPASQRSAQTFCRVGQNFVGV